MRNKVVHTLARAFEMAGARTLRFNFRGVGKSEGIFGDSVGETEDALAVLEWVRERQPDDEIWLAGFSFGAAVALRAAIRFPIARLITVAPAVHLYPDLEALQPPAVPWLLVMGTADEVVTPESALAWARGRRHPPELAQLEGAGHFFHQRLPKLRETVLQFLAGPA